MNYKLLLLSALILLFSCTNDSKNTNNKRSSKAITELEITADAVDLTEEYLNNYHTQTVFSNGGNDYMVAHNHKTHHIDLFNITTKEKRTIKLNAEGQNSVHQNVNGIYTISPDAVWIYAMSDVYLMNTTTGEIEAKYKLPVDEGEFIINTSNYSNATIKLQYDADRNSLRYITIDMGDRSYFYINEFDIETGTVRKSELEYTEAEQGIGEKFGWMQHPNVTYNKNMVVYNFPFNSNIYTLNLDTQEMNSYGGKSSFTNNFASEIDQMSMDKWMNHAIENVHFYEVNYDAYKDCYYRLHSEGIDFDPNVPLGELFQKKKLYLTIFDGDLNVINEFQLAANKYPLSGGWGVLKSGFFIINDSPDKEIEGYERLEYDIIEGK